MSEMEARIELNVYGIEDGVKQMIQEKTMAMLPFILKEDSYFFRQLSEDSSREIFHHIFFSELGTAFKKELLSEIVKSMSDDEKKKLIIEALIRNR